MFPLKCGVPNLQDRQNFGKSGCVFAVFDVSVPDFSSFLFCIEILNPFLSISKVPFELNEKPKLFVGF